jgi:hypothetical protein
MRWLIPLLLILGCAHDEAKVTHGYRYMPDFTGDYPPAHASIYVEPNRP